MANNNKVNPDTGLFMSRKEMELQLKLMTESRNFWKDMYYDSEGNIIDSKLNEKG